MADKSAEFDRLYESYHLSVYKLAYVYTKNRADSEDLVQELFIKLCYNSPRFKSEAHERAWVIRVTVNLAKNFLKKAYKRRESPVDEFFVADEGVKTDETLENVMALPEKYKAAVILYYYNGYSVAETAKILHITLSNAKVRLKRARELLRIELESE